MKKFDLAIIGAGPGGYVAAIKAAQLGLAVALIEKQFLGGTCLNVGCIPTKTLIANAHMLEMIKKAKEFGIEVGPVHFDYEKMKNRKDETVEKIRKSLENLLLANKITIFKGIASFTSPSTLKIQGEENREIEAEKIIIATGSAPMDIPAFPCDGKKIHNSTTIMELTTLPKKLAIIGGGYIGCEFASLFAQLGCEVTILEALPEILSLQGSMVSKVMREAYTKQGVTIETNVFVEGIDVRKNDLLIRLSGKKEIISDMALIAVGRKLSNQNLGLDKAGIVVNEKGAIVVNDKMETEVPGIYAIGDITGKWLLAHVASHQGMVAAENAAGMNKKIHYHAVPSVIFTSPEIAQVGRTLEAAIEQGFNATSGTFPFQALGKAQASLDTDGFVQVISDKKTGQILGAHAVGHEASTLIAEMTLAIQNELTVDCVIDTIHAHPTIAEAWLEAALVANDTPIHLPPSRKKL